MIFLAFVCLFAFALGELETPTALDEENRALKKVNLALTKALGELEKATETERAVGNSQCDHINDDNKSYECNGYYKKIVKCEICQDDNAGAVDNSAINEAIHNPEQEVGYGPGMFELMLPPRDCNGDNFDRDCLGCRDYQDTCCVNTNCASLRKCEWNNEAWRCNSYIFGWMGEKTDQEAQVGYEVSCQHDSDCTSPYYVCAHGRCSMPTVATDTDQETQVGYEVSCQHDYDCTSKYYICLHGRCSMPTGATDTSFDFTKIGDSYCSGDQNNRLKNLGRISVHRCAEACSKTEGCNAIQMDCGTDCYLLPACTRPVGSGCGSHSYSVGATNDATSEEQEVGATDRKF